MGLIDEREKTHGSFVRTAERAVALQSASAPVNEPAYLKHAREMICVKLARIASGGPLFLDHWRDIAGYAELAARRLAEESTAAGAGPQERAECDCDTPSYCSIRGCFARRNAAPEPGKGS